MKGKLIVQSLLPIFIITLIRNFSFKTCNDAGVLYSFGDFLGQNICHLLVTLVCFIWFLLSALFFWQFTHFVNYGKQGGYHITEIKENRTASIEFYITIIIPLVAGELNSIQNVISYIIILILLLILMFRTNLYYANPVLALLGYKVYTFSFKKNPEMNSQAYTGIAYKDNLVAEKTIRYKSIDSETLFVDQKG